MVDHSNFHGFSGPTFSVIELDDGKILTGKPDQFDGKNPWFPVDFPNKTNPMFSVIRMCWGHRIAKKSATKGGFRWPPAMRKRS